MWAPPSGVSVPVDKVEAILSGRTLWGKAQMLGDRDWSAWGDECGGQAHQVGLGLWDYAVGRPGTTLNIRLA